ncbi:HAD family hydrolase [Nonomuraea sp. MG754425]|uniref:HAD-IA family hydrolase n=1 Tax=Nonomuraea sp. MG754425 TaxID=2570319 RepID=UPI001F02099C|nr:HAD-IA family hydrolase [Nonomuraea sp. MG754425]MCF6471658.1 HAD family hydrolase [Nonomuraea sp. MG754425]
MSGHRGRHIVSLERIARNYTWAVRRHPAGVLPVLKGDAYGHGLVPVAMTLRDAGARHLFVGSLAEAGKLRRAGWRAALTVLRPAKDAYECDEFRRLDAAPTLGCAADVSVVAGHGRLGRVDLEADAGLGRGGLTVGDLPAAVGRLGSGATSIGVGFQAPATMDAGGAVTMVRDIAAAVPSVHVHVGGSALAGAPVAVPVRAGRLLFGVVPSRMREQRPPLGAAGAWLATARPIEAGPTIGYATEASAAGCAHYELDLGYADGLPSHAVGWEVAAGDRLLRLAAVFMNRSVAVGRSGAAPEPAEVLVMGEHPEHRPRPLREFAEHLGCSQTEALLLPKARATYTDHQVCVFDMDGVLRHWDPDAATRVDRDTALPPGTFDRFAFQLPQYHDAMIGHARFEDWCTEIERHLAARSGPARAAAAVAAWKRHRGTLDPEVVALLREARRRVRVVILSNAHDCLRTDLAALGLDTEVDDVYGSAELALAKPDPAVFAHVTEALGVPPHRCFFVDDLPENVAAARRAGWDAVRFRSPARLRAELRLRRLCG